MLAEPVGSGDGGGVEVGQGGGEQLAPLSYLFGRPGGQQGHDVVVVGWGDAGHHPGQLVLSADQAPADTVTQFPCGHASEGDQQELLEGDSRRHVAGGQAGDGKGLARAGAGLEHRDPAGQWSADVERGGVVRRAHRSTSSSHCSSPFQSRRA